MAMAAYRHILGRALDTSALPYTPYGGELTAPINAQQQAGIAGINQNAGFAQPYISEAADFTRQAAQPLSAEDIARYQSPHTQQVVDSTSAWFNNQNQQQQQNLLGLAAKQGALGGDRLGVAQANLASQQTLSQAPVIAGLYNQGYTQALSTAQQQQANQANAAYALGNFGVAGQNAALTGANAQVGAGNLLYGNEQQRLAALYDQFRTAQAFPYQQTQWLAGVGSGLGSQMGGTSSTSSPEPNQWGQIAGLGLTAASMFLSDRDAKTDIHKIGSTNDGQPIYKYRYKGQPGYQIGLIAQEVEKSHPEAVHAGVDGMRFVDIDAATEDAERAYGGRIPGFAPGGATGSDMPYGGVGWIPYVQLTGGRGAPAPPGVSAPQKSGNELGAGLNAVAGKLRGFGNAPLDISAPGVAGFTPSPVGTVFPMGMGASGLPPIYAAGGVVHSYADGGVPFDDRFGAAFDLTPNDYVDLGFRDTSDAMQTGIFDPQGSNASFPSGPQYAGVGQDVVPMPVPRPAFEPTGVALGEPVAEGQAMSFAPEAPASGFVPRPDNVPPRTFAAEAEIPPNAQPTQGFGLGLIPERFQMPLMQAGLAMMASKSPHFLSAVGEGGLAGVQAYTRQKHEEALRAEKKEDIGLRTRRLDLDAKRLDQVAEDARKRLAETSRHNLAVEGSALKPILTDIGRDEYGNPKKGIWDPRTQTVKPLESGTPHVPGAPVSEIKPPAAPPAQISEEDSAIPKTATFVSGDDVFLRGLSVGEQKMVKAMVEGRQPPPPGRALATPYWRRMVELAQTYDPTFDMSRWSARVQTRKNFATGVEGRIVRSLNTVMNHIDELDEAGKALDTWRSGTLGPATKSVNALTNWYREHQQDPKVRRFETTSTAVANELEKAFRGNQTAISGIKEWRQGMRPSMAADEMKEANKTLVKLLVGQLEGLGGQYSAGMGVNADPLTLIQPDAAKTIKRILGTEPQTTTKKTEGEGEKPASTAPQRPSTVPSGSQYSPSRKQWRDKSGKIYDAEGNPVQ